MSDQSLEKISKANKEQILHGLLIETYCQSVKSQPNVNFSGDSKLKKYEKEINTRLKQAQKHADTYLNFIQPKILKNISNISDYYSLQNAIPTTIPETATKEQWLEVLEELQKKAAEYHCTSVETEKSLRKLYDDLTQDAAAFAQTVSELQASTSGNKQELEEIKKQLTDIESKIKGTIVGIVISGLGVVGGVFITAVGSIAGFVTAGTSTPLVILGAGLTVGGISGAIGMSQELMGLYTEKARLLTDNRNLTAEVKVAVAIEEGFVNLKDEVNRAITATRQMANAWGNLGNNLNHLSEKLKKGIDSTDTVIRTWFLNAANSMLQEQVIQEIKTIKQQMTGVRQLPVILIAT